MKFIKKKKNSAIASHTQIFFYISSLYIIKGFVAAVSRIERGGGSGGRIIPNPPKARLF